MKHIIQACAVGGLMLLGAQAFADDATPPSGVTSKSTTMSRTSAPSKHQLMKDCMARQKAADSSMSKADVKKACDEQVKAQMENSSAAPSSPSGN